MNETGEAAIERDSLVKEFNDAEGYYNTWETDRSNISTATDPVRR
jgi:hypothetical protein